MTADTSLPPGDGDTFTLRLVPSASTGSLNDSPETYFNVFDFGNGTEVSSVAFASNPGTVGVRSVPEPAALGLFILGMASLFLRFARRGRHAANDVRPASTCISLGN